MKAATVCGIGMVALALSVGSAHAESVWVKTPTVEMREGRNSLYRVTGTATKGAELTVLGREDGWIQVQSGNVKGWVFENALSQKVDAGFNLGSVRSADMSSGAAIRGVNPTAAAYAKGKNYNTVALDQLVKLNKSIPPQEWEAFNRQMRTENPTR